MAKYNLFRTRLGRIVWIVTSPVLVLTWLAVSLATNQAWAASSKGTALSQTSSLALQSTATSTPTLPNDLQPALLQSTSNYSFSLATLGYGETSLTSPLDNVDYAFRLPEDWLIQTDGLLELDLSYFYDQVDAENYPAQFGNLSVKLNNETLEIFTLEERELNHYLLQIPLPQSLLASDRSQHVISLQLEAGFLCQVPHDATLIVHPTSSVLLNYGQRPLVLDLARYPRPFYQRAFAPDRVRFVLPSELTTSDLTGAAAVAARLGSLTGNQLAITTTTDVDFSRLLASNPVTDEHLIIIGTPENNDLLPLLNETTELPVSLHHQQLELITEGPNAVAPGDTFNYVFTITNVITQPVNLSLISALPSYTEFVTCTADCAPNSSNRTVTWSDIRLAPDEMANFTLTLEAVDTLTGTTLENIVTLIEADRGPVNADTLTSFITSDSADSEPTVSVVDESGYFFIYNGQAVAKGDGIVQEILSPWSEGRAILIITGLNDEAIKKAGQAMSSETRLPGMSGPVALVQDILPLPERDQAELNIEVTFEELGYSDQFLQGEFTPQADYLLDIPYGWQLTDEAFVEVYFTHSQLINYEGSGLNVLLNGSPVASIALNEETANDGYLYLSLGDANLLSNRSNRLGFQANLLPLSPVSDCVDAESGQAWLRIKNSSTMFLAHTEESEADLDLRSFPRPFDTDQTLSSLLFALPSTPAVDEWGAVIRLAASLGSIVKGRTILPVATVGEDFPSEDLADYHIIAIGRPSRNPLIQQVNDQLPQPFLPGSDEIEQRLENIVFRLPPGIDLGYIQLIPSPWNESRAFLAVTGTTDTSVQNTVNMLLGRPSLDGNLAFIKDGQVRTIDTRPLMRDGVAEAIVTALPEMTPEVIATATPALSPISSTLVLTEAEADIPVAAQTLSPTRPGWLIPLVGANGLIVAAIFAFIFWRARRRTS